MGELVDAAIAWRDVFLEKDWIQHDAVRFSSDGAITGVCLGGALVALVKPQHDLGSRLVTLAYQIANERFAAVDHIVFNDHPKTTRQDIDDFFDRLIRRCKEIEAEAEDKARG